MQNELHCKLNFERQACFLLLSCDNILFIFLFFIVRKFECVTYSMIRIQFKHDINKVCVSLQTICFDMPVVVFNLKFCTFFKI